VTSTARGIGLDGLRDEVEQLLVDAPVGEPLAPMTRSLVEYGVRSSVTILDLAGARVAASAALDAGATAGQLHEVLALVSGLGVHTLMEGSRDLAGLLTSRGDALPELDEHRSDLRDQLLGPATSYWDIFESHVPGFLDAVLRLSPEAFEGFVSYGAIPARTRQLRPVVKEIVSVAVDALPNHRYLPGLRLHLATALKLGAGRTEIIEAIDLAAAAPAPPGVG
jgi:alkylhydroperoxidase/carboxymuconolactone decarboxylase family protein YurZ